MRVILLGVAAGGGLPQWNCACQPCRLARHGTLPPSTQSSVAVSADGEFWFLINASPDLPGQIEAASFLRARGDQPGGLPFEGVLLTNADLDHVLGLFLLREGERFPLYATAGVRDALERGLNLGSTLDAYCGVEWRQPPETELQPLLLHDGSKSGLLFRAIALAQTPPRYAATAGGTQSVAYEIQDAQTRRRLVVAPDVAAVSAEFAGALERADAVLLDGTFWTSNELRQVRPGARTAEEMGHWPMEQSLELMHRLPARRKIYLHVNNTNPVWLPDSAARRQVEAAGVEIGRDGLEFDV